MRTTLFKTDFYQYPIIDWLDKKNKILDNIKINDLEKNPAQNFFSDRNINKLEYLKQFSEIFKDELNAFRNELGVANFKLTEIWTARYGKGDFHAPHNHGGNGFSGIVYLEYDDDEHTPAYFINPINDPISDRTKLIVPNTFEGLMIIVPSIIHHYTLPNTSDKYRTIIGFDIKF